MRIGAELVGFSTNHPKVTAFLTVLVTVALALGVAIPSALPDVFPMLHAVRVDTDPENMLSQNEPVRVFHRAMKAALGLHDIVVLGVVNETHPDGVFNPESLGRVYELTEYAKTLRGAAIGLEDAQAGVVEVDVIAPSTVDNIEQGGVGVVKFEWLMAQPPETEAEARAVRDKAKRIPFLEGTMLSENGKALCLYLPLTSKDLSYRVYSRLREKIEAFEGDDQFFITGLPVANDTFGVEMFIQMAISAPLAMLVIFLLMLLFFRKLVLVIAPLVLALFSVIITMGLLVMTGNTIHIMSSMIPIFIMPISILDSIHILSEFFDRYQEFKDRKKTITHVVETLFTAMLYTSLTSAAGFASLALTPIPPVQIFGLFVAFGILVAWFLTVTFIPAFVMFIPERYLANFGAKHEAEKDGPRPGRLLDRVLARAGRLTYAHARWVLVLTGITAALAGYGISRVEVNDNPTKWFKKSHPIRVADAVLNKHFGGTYMAYLALMPEETAENVPQYAQEFNQRWKARAGELAASTPGVDALPLAEEVQRLAREVESKKDLLAKVTEFAETRADAAEGDAAYAWDEAVFFIDEELQRDELFKQPEALAYIARLQEHLLRTGVVGKSNSLTDIVKTVYRELMEGAEEYFRVPDSAKAVGQCLITYESSHRPHDVYHFVTPDYRTSSIWVQLTSGDNKDMSRVVETVDDFVAQNPPPYNLKHRWFGLTYINVVWQEKMVGGMLQSFLGSFLVVLLMMIVLFRSGLWGFLSMIPLAVTIGLIYGVIGFVGKDYDMPVAVLSSLTLGLAVDFAIHFLSRTRTLYERHGSWQATVGAMFGEPARAIVRNVIAVAIGFTPLLLAPLVPYNTVGVFMAAILGVSGAATLLILPALARYLEPLMFPKSRLCSVTCKCATCVLSVAVGTAMVAVNVRQFFAVGWNKLVVLSLVGIALAAVSCHLIHRRQEAQENPECD